MNISTASLPRPIGLAPSEISALVNRDVVSQHAEEAAFLWTLRNRAVGEPHYSLSDLTVLDDRVEAHRDGLTIAADAGWDIANATLAVKGPAEVFALSVLAFDAGNRERMSAVLQAACASPKAVAGLVSALGWLEYTHVSKWIAKLLEARSPLHRAVGIAACAIHRQDPGPPLALAVNDDDPVLRGRALRAVGEIKRHDLLGSVRSHLVDEDESCRFWAAWSATLLGRRDTLGLLTGHVECGDRFGGRALQLCLRAMGSDASRRWVSSIAMEAGLERSAIMATGIVGDPVAIPWLINKMESPDVARLAGEAFTMITGVDLAYHDLEQDAPSLPETPESTSIEEVLDLYYDSNLPWPSAALVSRWWEQNHRPFSPGTRYLVGQRITSQSLANILINGKQRQRAAAALEAAVRDADRPLWEVRAPARRQSRGLATWNS